MSSASDAELLADVTRFLYREARYQDEHDYDAWEALWTDDALYWIPANGDDLDPETQMSIVYDNRSRIALRIRQLHTGKRHTQSPRSRLRRIVSNIDILGRTGPDDNDLSVTANALVYESNLRGETIWASRNDYVLRFVPGPGSGPDVKAELRMAKKKVILANNQAALFTLSFLI